MLKIAFKPYQLSVVRRALPGSVSVRALSTGEASSKGSGQYAETDLRLRDDVRMLGKILGNSIQSHHPKVFEEVEKLRKLGREVYTPFALLYLFSHVLIYVLSNK
jgi:hypothetical protein